METSSAGLKYQQVTRYHQDVLNNKGVRRGPIDDQPLTVRLASQRVSEILRACKSKTATFNKITLRVSRQQSVLCYSGRLSPSLYSRYVGATSESSSWPGRYQVFVATHTRSVEDP